MLLSIQKEIAQSGVLPLSDLQKTFRLRFRAPYYSMFVDIVKECVDANVFGSGKRRAKIGVDFKVLTCLRILGRNFVCDSVVEILNTGVIIVNNVFKDFVDNYSAAYYDKYVYIHRLHAIIQYNIYTCVIYAIESKLLCACSTWSQFCTWCSFV